MSTNTHPAANAPIIMEGWLRKRSSRVSGSKFWSDRYFVLRETSLCYYLRKSDVEVKGQMQLVRGCTVSPIVTDERKSRSKKQAQQQAQQQDGINYNSGLDEGYRSDFNNATPTRSTSTNSNNNTPHNNNSSSSRREKMYLIKITWPTNNSNSNSNDTTSNNNTNTNTNTAEVPPTLMEGPNQASTSIDAEDDHITTVLVAQNNTTTTSNSNNSNIMLDANTNASPSTDPTNNGDHTITTTNTANTTAPSTPTAMVSPMPKRSRSRSSSGAPDSPLTANANANEVSSSTIMVDLAADTMTMEDDYTTWESARTISNSNNTSPGVAARSTSKDKAKKRLIQGSKYAAATGAAVTVGVLTAGVGLAAGLTFVAVSAAAGGGGAVASRTLSRSRKEKDMHERTLILGTYDYDDAQRWKVAIEVVISRLDFHYNNVNTHANAAVNSSSLAAAAAANGNRVDFAADGGVGCAYEQILAILRLNKDASVQGHVQFADGTTFRNTTANYSPYGSNNNNNENDGSNSMHQSKWKPVEGGWATLLSTGSHGLRIYAEDVPPQYYANDDASSNKRKSTRNYRPWRREVSVEGRPCPPLKSQVILNAKPLDAFVYLMTRGRVQNIDPNHGTGENLSAFRVIDKMDEHMDVIHLIFRPLYLFPSWTAPRDFCLQRYWRYEDDGSYIVCYDSVKHRECPPMKDYVRGELHGVYMISPRKSRHSIHGEEDKQPPECLMTQIVQVDPRGWVPTMKLPALAHQGYADAFSVSALLQMLDIRDALNYSRFMVSDRVSVYRATQTARNLTKTLTAEQTGGVATQDPATVVTDDEGEDNNGSYDYRFANEREQKLDDSAGGKGKGGDVAPNEAKMEASVGKGGAIGVGEKIRMVPPPLNQNMWAEPDSNSFRVRGKKYKVDKKKENAGDAMFRLLAVDLVETSSNIMSGMCSHPKERIQRALERESKGIKGEMPPFVFALNIAIPGPPHYHCVIYYAVDDMDLINGNAGTPFSTLASKFFFGDDDTFRDKTFKLIPQIIEGNFIVRKAVGSTPAIMGTKLKQLYSRTDRYFEIILDIGSSSVAAGVIRLASGYAKTLIVDMAFVLEGNDESVLPEKVMGSCRLKHISFKGLRQVALPEDYE
eukprot:CAMPEP_0116031236 /NCGR_PEP_ID=MMETSP0321-20121206/17383_1 /TAXON_ID=163516 /ORGANISM="Leptocylindrus danicus var. danicus, Strain B650" /LENGTH=1121 /DNA_ID=CAMNT_0003506301 /DNA_START=101 /DNA_END=3466 /DNA_ORIENTATION=-